MANPSDGRTLKSISIYSDATKRFTVSGMEADRFSRIRYWRCYRHHHLRRHHPQQQQRLRHRPRSVAVLRCLETCIACPKKAFTTASER